VRVRPPPSRGKAPLPEGPVKGVPGEGASLNKYFTQDKLWTAQIGLQNLFWLLLVSALTGSD
jgi:hypothetical protein